MQVVGLVDVPAAVHGCQGNRVGHGKPVVACFAQAPFTKEAVEEFAAKSLARPLTVVSDGPGVLHRGRRRRRS